VREQRASSGEIRVIFGYRPNFNQRRDAAATMADRLSDAASGLD
jgi:hypothetical protein